MEYTFTIGREHAALPGHFPGNPVVPGVVVLGEVAAAWQCLRPGATLTGLPNAKFLSPLRPEEACTVRFSPGAAGRIRFECSVGERLVANGSFAWEDNA